MSQKLTIFHKCYNFQNVTILGKNLHKRVSSYKLRNKVHKNVTFHAKRALGNFFLEMHYIMHSCRASFAQLTISKLVNTCQVITNLIAVVNRYRKSFKSIKFVYSRKEIHCYGNVNSKMVGNMALEWYGVSVKLESYLWS